MTKQELKDLMKWSYPRSAEAEEKLLFRVNLFPKSLEIYHDHLQNIYTRSDVWFLLEQLMPEAAHESAGGVNPFRKIDNFISHYIYLGGTSYLVQKMLIGKLFMRSLMVKRVAIL